jgi:hypothetical protein
MSKPIFIIKAPINISKEKSVDVIESFKSKAFDYHVFLVNNIDTSWDFQVFSEKEIDPIRLQELKILLNYENT